MNKEKTEKNTDISARIIVMLESLNVSANEFAQKIGYARAQTVYDAIKGKVTPKFEFYERFVNSEYSAKINIEWLLTGKGEMLKSSAVYQNNVKVNGHNINGNNNVSIGKSQTDELIDLLKAKDEQVDKSQEQISKSQEQISKSQEQIDRLIGLIEKMNKI